MNENDLIDHAKRLALDDINKNRAERHPPLPPLKRVESLWWSLYGRDWIAKAKTLSELNLL